jgi:hypothetical protein
MDAMRSYFNAFDELNNAAFEGTLYRRQLSFACGDHDIVSGAQGCLCFGIQAPNEANLFPLHTVFISIGQFE